MPVKVSIIIPVYNEEKVIRNCLISLTEQTFKDLEIILVDDGSTDNSLKIIEGFNKNSSQKILILKQNHGGPGRARNLGVKHSLGNILVFVDADMQFDKDFVKNLIKPIIDGRAIGTFTKEEYLLNSSSNLAKCWNINLGKPPKKMHPNNYPEKQEVFRAIVKKEFLKVEGFDENIGYTDDWSLSRKLNTLANSAPGAAIYHTNPESLGEVWTQARWFGKNEFLTGSLGRRIYNLFRFNPAFSLFKGFFYFFKSGIPLFLIFKPVFDSAVFLSVLMSFFGEKKYR